MSTNQVPIIDWLNGLVMGIANCDVWGNSATPGMWLGFPGAISEEAAMFSTVLQEINLWLTTVTPLVR